jgi:hypothetical protein
MATKDHPGQSGALRRKNGKNGEGGEATRSSSRREAAQERTKEDQEQESQAVRSGMRLFQLHRTEDESGVSGTGIVAEGVEYSCGWVCIVWLTKLRSLGFYENLKELEAIHGHQGKTKVVFLDDQGKNE